MSVSGVVAALRWRPAWPFALVVLGAWAAVLAWPGGTGHAGADHVGARHGAGLAATADGGLVGPLAHWTVMAVAMMLPLALPALQHVGRNSMRSRRLRGMGIFAAVYLGVWVAFGAVVLAVLAVQRSAVPGPEVEALLLPLALAVAAGWQLTRAKRRALIGCRRTVPLPPLGLRADAGCARFALVQARRCLISCWALMLVMALVTGLAAVAWMAALTALVVLEDLTPLRGQVRRISAVALVLSAGLVAVGA